MAGSVDLDHLLRTLSPDLVAGEFVFATIDAESADPSRLLPIATFLENEGLTLVLAVEVAEAEGLQSEGPFRQITLQVQSSLEAVGLTAAVSTALADAGISANVVAAFHHDHVFVPSVDAERALAVLQRLSAAARGRE